MNINPSSGPSKARRETHSEEWAELIRITHENPGQWFTVENFRSSVSSHISKGRGVWGSSGPYETTMRGTKLDENNAKRGTLYIRYLGSD